MGEGKPSSKECTAVHCTRVAPLYENLIRATTTHRETVVLKSNFPMLISLIESLIDERITA